MPSHKVIGFFDKVILTLKKNIPLGLKKLRWTFGEHSRNLSIFSMPLVFGTANTRIKPFSQKLSSSFNFLICRCIVLILCKHKRLNTLRRYSLS